MKRQYVELKVNIGGVKADIEKALHYIDASYRQVNAYMLQINPTTVADAAREAAQNAMLANRIRITPRGGGSGKTETKKILEGFVARESKKPGLKSIRLSHKYFTGFAPTIVRKTRNQTFRLSARTLYNILDTGRKRYFIVKAGNQKQSASPLVFYWKKMSRWVVFHWKGPKGGRKRFITVNPNAYQVDYTRGARFTEAAVAAVEKMVDERFAKI